MSQHEQNPPKFAGDLSFEQWEEVERRDHEAQIWKGQAWVSIHRKQLEEAPAHASAAYLAQKREELALAEQGLRIAEQRFEAWKNRDHMKAFAEHAYQQGLLRQYRREHGKGAQPPAIQPNEGEAEL